MNGPLAELRRRLKGQNALVGVVGLGVVVIVRQAVEAFERRGLQWATTRLPVPADVLVYTEAAWDRLRQADPCGRRIAREVIGVR